MPSKLGRNRDFFKLSSLVWYVFEVGLTTSSYGFLNRLQDYAAAGTLQSNYVNILWMLLRLRQACDHPLLVKGHHYQSTQKVVLDSAKKLTAEKRQHLLSLLEGNRDICRICSVRHSSFIHVDAFCRSCGD